MTYNELAKIKDTLCGNLSTKDYEEVFRGIDGKETKLRGYYDNNNNWSQVEFSQGLGVHWESKEYEMLKLLMETMGKQVEVLSHDMNLMCGFIKRKFPAKDWFTMVAAKENNIENIHEQVNKNVSREIVNNIESYDNVHSSPNVEQVV
uniref:Uncharacterized protein n=1 Tax=Oryza brachyantha TaxID=4533 RepID=J3ND13_ORYBR